MAILSYRKRCPREKRDFARSLRQNPTLTERLLWVELQRKKLGVKFRRQAIILGYIVDFYCPQRRLVIECDGSGHNKRYDVFRDSIMTDKGFIILRFDNKTIRNDLLSVITTIRAYCPPL